MSNPPSHGSTDAEEDDEAEEKGEDDDDPAGHADADGGGGADDDAGHAAAAASSLVASPALAPAPEWSASTKKREGSNRSGSAKTAGSWCCAR